MFKAPFHKLFQMPTTSGPSKLFWWILVSFLIMFIIQFSQNHSLSFSEFTQQLTNSYIINSILAFFRIVGSSMSSTTLIMNTTTVPSEIVIEIDNRIPSYKLAIKFDDKLFSAAYLGQGKLLDELRLHEVCQQDSSKIVVDVGAQRGDFGLYAAACGCTVYFFEIQPEMVNLISSSIEHNSFSSDRVRLFQYVVRDLPSDSIIKYEPREGTVTLPDDPVQIPTIRLDDVKWPSPSPSIFLLRINVEGSELSVLRSAKNLFAKRSIQHLLFEYTPWITNQDPMDQLIPHLRKELRPKFVYALYPNEDIIYGPLLTGHLSRMYDEHRKSHLKTTVYAVFDRKARRNSIKSQPFEFKRA